MAERFRNIYARAPIPIQDALVSMQGWMFRYRRCSDRLLKRSYDELKKSESWSEDHFEAYQCQQLRQLLRHAFTTVPHYIELRQNLQCEPEDFQTLADLRRLPILEKRQVRGSEWRFRSSAYSDRVCKHGHTSGTTGTPIVTAETRESFARRWAFVARLRSWAGLPDPFYPRRAQFTGRDIVPDKWEEAYWRHNYFGNALLFSTTHISHESAGGYAKAIRDFHPDLVDGYPSAMRILARICAEDGHALPQVHAVIVSAETLTDGTRSELEAAFRCRVHNQYAASEPSCFWCDCEHGVLHQNPEYGISEIVDGNGRQVCPGESGDVVVTSFLNPAMTLIRYRLGDVAVLGPSTRCSCGRAMPRVQSVLGRRDDVLTIPGRGYIGRMDPVFKGVPGIIESQIIQDSLARIRVLVVPSHNFSPEAERRLRSNIMDKVGARIAVDIVVVAAIPRGANGKFRSVISSVTSSPRSSSLND